MMGGEGAEGLHDTSSQASAHGLIILGVAEVTGTLTSASEPSGVYGQRGP
jgi:hypothetical protein